MVDLTYQPNKSIGKLGEARQSGNSAVAAEFAVLSMWASIFWMTTGSSILAIMRTSPPHSLHVSTSILKTRFNRFAQVIEARFSAGVCSASSVEWHFLRSPRLAGVTFARYLLLGALCRPPDYADLIPPTPFTGGDRCDGVGIIKAPQGRP